MLVLNVLACNYIPHTNVLGGGGDIMVLSSLRRYANIKCTKILIGVLPRVTYVDLYRREDSWDER